MELDGSKLHSEADVHRELSRLLDFGPYYGHNLSALWDRLSKDVERPTHLVWLRSEHSRAALGPVFDRILKVVHDAAEEDVQLGPAKQRFTYELR